MKTGIEVIAEERERQIKSEGFNPQQDSTEHREGQLAVAGACYALASTYQSAIRSGRCTPDYWPFLAKWWRPSKNDRIKELAKAGALIAAEIDRLQAEQK